jgi:hypothetical protein
MILISLVGEQPLPTLLIDQSLKPERHLLLNSALTQPVANRLKELLPGAELLLVPDPYALEDLRKLMNEFCGATTIFNLTSGTKPMSWAGYEAARSAGAMIIYLQSETKKSVLYEISFTKEGTRTTSRELPDCLTLDLYLRAHGLHAPAPKSLSNSQEVAIFNFLKGQVDECLRNLQFPAFEIDFLIRRGNQVAVIEAKSGLSRYGRKRDGIDQLTTITGREYLGTYTGRIWVVAKMPGVQLRELANAYQIEIVQVNVQEHGGRWRLDSTSQVRLAKTLDIILGPKTIH